MVSHWNITLYIPLKHLQKYILLLTSKNGGLFSSVDVKGCRIGVTLGFISVLVTISSLTDGSISIS